MACHRWPTDPSKCHSISWAQHQANKQAQSQPAPRKGLNPDGSVPGAPAPRKGLNPDGSVPGAPAPPPAPPPTFTPDSIYNTAVAQADARHRDTLTNLDTDERRTKHEYGFDDPTNPFSRVNEMKRTFLNRGTQITGNLGARGQLYSGYHRAKLASNQRNQSKANAALRQAYDAALEAIRRSRTAADRELEERKLDARREAMARQGVTS